MRRLVLALLAFGALALGTPGASAQTTFPARISPGSTIDVPYSRPLGIGLEAVPYPYPVRFLDREVEGQPVRMAYMDVLPTPGKPTLPTPILLLHGKNFYGAYWKNTIATLVSAGYRVIVPDQIGFGKSSKPDISYSFDLLAQNTLALLNALHVEKVAVVGHSMGGMLAVRFACNYPQRTEKLVLEDPIGLEDYRAFVPPVPIERLYADELADTDVAKIRAFYKKYFVTWKPEYERFVEVEARLTHSGEWPRWAKASARTYQMILQQPTVYDLPRIAAPTLIVIGQADRTVVGRAYAEKGDEGARAKSAAGVTPRQLRYLTAGNYPELGKRAAKAIPNARLVELANIGHIPHLEAPQQFHAALLKFLNN